MALLCIEGFDNINKWQLAGKGWVAAYASFNDVGVNYSRWPTGYGWRISNCLGWVQYEGALKRNPSNEIYMGVAIHKYNAGTPGISNSEPLLCFKDETGNNHVIVRVNPNLGITVVDGAGAVTLGTTDNNLILNQVWQYLEFRVKIHDTAGEVEVRINEQTVLNETGLDTKGAGASNNIGAIYMNCIFNDIDTYFDDFYVDDAQFHGNIRVRTFMPDSDSGTHAQWTRSGGSNDYECIDEVPANDDTDYIYTTTKGHKSAFGITTGVIGVVKGVRLAHKIKAAASGVRRVRPFVRSGGADYEGPPGAVLTADYNFTLNVWQNDPQDGQPWNQTKLEAAEFGLRLVDGSTTTSTTSTTTTT